MEVFPEDQGQYICVAENPAGQATTTAYLTIIESEETTMELEAQPQEITATAGEEVVFTVQIPTAEEPMETEEQKLVEEETIFVSEVREEEVVPSVIDRPKVEPLVKEELLIESPIFESPIPESLTGTESSDVYYTAQEEVEEEVTEVAIAAKVIDRPKLVPLVAERISESPEHDASEVEEIPESETPTEEVQEELLEKVTAVREIKLPQTLTEEKPTEHPMKEELVVESPVLLETSVQEPVVLTEEVTFTITAGQGPEEETEIKSVPTFEAPVEVRFLFTILLIRISFFCFLYTSTI